ncbi:MAG: acyltransferase [Myxococcales bacterium]|nr:acyltransferase [Myxococcales bacterium]
MMRGLLTKVAKLYFSVLKPGWRRFWFIFRLRVVSALVNAPLELHVGKNLTLGKNVELSIVGGTKNKLWIGDNVLIDDRVWIQLNGGDVHLGDRTEFRRECILKFGGKYRMDTLSGFAQRCVVHNLHDIHIESYVVITEYTSLVDFNYELEDQNEADANWYYHGKKVCAPIHIEESVWIAGKCTITKGVTIGRGAMVAANSLISRDVKPGHLAVGVPARQFPINKGKEAPAKDKNDEKKAS